MKNLKRAVFTLFVVISLTNSYAQTADGIIAKYIDAIGGIEKLKSIVSVHMENSMQVMGNDAPSSTTLLVGKGFRNESEFNGQKVIQVITEKGGWVLNQMAGQTDPVFFSEDQFKSVKGQLYFVPFIDYISRGSKAELAGKEKTGNADAYKIIFTDKDSISTTFYFDASTYYIIKTVRKMNMGGQETEISIAFSDFKKSDFGVTIPFSSEIDFGGQFSAVSKLNKVEFNMPVDVSIFEMKK